MVLAEVAELLMDKMGVSSDQVTSGLANLRRRLEEHKRIVELDAGKNATEQVQQSLPACPHEPGTQASKAEVDALVRRLEK